MKREDIIAAVEAERESQDINWPRDDRRKSMYAFSAPHILLLEHKLSSMRTAWYTSDVHASDFIKIAALAVRALEEISKSELK